MANQYGIDMGNVLRAKILSEEHKAKQDDRETARARTGAIGVARQKAASGDPEGMQELLTLAPDEALKLQTYFGNADKKERENIKRLNENSARMGITVLKSKDPAKTYAILRENLPEKLQATMPEEYSPDHVQYMVSRAAEVDQLMENPKVVTMGGKDIMFQGGQEVARSPSNALLKANAKAGASGGLKAADSNAIFRQTVERLGGLVDAEGNVRMMDPTQRPKVQAIAARAAEILQGGEVGKNHAAAVQIAAEEMGESPFAGNALAPPPTTKTDPLGIRRVP